MKFSELEGLTDAVSEKMNQAVNIRVSYWRFEKSNQKEKTYEFYNEHGNNVKFETADLLKGHMENILNPATDCEITL